MDFLKFLFTKLFLKNLAIAGGILLVLLSSVFIFLRIYTLHGESLSIPDLSGLTNDEIKTTLDQLNLNYVISDSVFLINFDRGTAIDQFPKPGFKVKKGRKIYVTMNAMNPERIRMPRATDVSLRQAKAILERNGLKLGNLIYRPYYYKNLVLDQRYLGRSIESGDSVQKGAHIDLVLGNGLSNVNTPVPNLIGKTVVDCEAILAGAFLNLGAVISDDLSQHPDDSIIRMVYMQKPTGDEGKVIPLGSFVDIWITSDSTRVFPEMFIDKQDDEDI